MIKGVIFDAGGLLYYREKHEKETLLSVLKRRGWKKREEFFDKARLFDGLRELSFRGIITRREAIISFLEVLGIRDETQQDSIFTLHDEEYQNNMIFPQDVPEVVQDLRAMGLKLAILSDAHYSSAEKKQWLARVEIDEMFEDIVCSCDIGYRKPHKSAYTIALGRLGIAAGEAAFIGHSLKDLGGAVNACITAIGVGCPEVSTHLMDVRLAKLSGVPESLRWIEEHAPKGPRQCSHSK